MTLTIRQLPGNKSQLMDPKGFPKDQLMFNPSADGDIVYIRGTRHTAHDETNFAVLHNTETKKTVTVESPMDLLAPTANLFKGLEDMRIVNYRGRVWFTATATHASDEQNNEMLVGHFDEALTRVERLSPISAGPPPVKNICPFVWPPPPGGPGTPEHPDARLRLLDTYKRIVYEVSELYEDAPEPAEDAPEPAEDAPAPAPAAPPRFLRFILTKVAAIRSAAGIPDIGFRGSTSPIHLHGNTWGCVVHDIIFNDTTRLVTRLAYFHYWMEIDLARGVVTFMSAPFWLAHWGVEYVSGLRRSKREQNVVEIYFGVNDQVPMMALTRLADLRAGK
jgi:hypothetical protein